MSGSTRVSYVAAEALASATDPSVRVSYLAAEVLVSLAEGVPVSGVRRPGRHAG